MTPKLTTTADDESRRSTSREAFIEATEAYVSEVAAAQARRILEEDDELVREYLELDQVRRILRVGWTRMRELVRTGELASVQPGKRILVPRAELVRYLDEQLRR